MHFKDRDHAGKTLADAIAWEWKDSNPIVVALPRGGVMVAYPIARQLGAPLAVLEMGRQEKIFRGQRGPLEVKSRSVILVDDGLATGSTLLAAVASLKARGASEVAVVVPVASREAVGLLEGEADRVYAALEPESFQSVGEWYEDFEWVSDEEVARLLRSGPKRGSGRR